MKVEDAVSRMTKAYLHRILDSYTKDIHKPDEQDCRNRLVRDLEDLSSRESIEKRFDLSEIDFTSKTLMTFILEILLEKEDFIEEEGSLIQAVQEREEYIIKAANDPDSLKYRDSDKVDTYSTVLEVALQDAVITEDEKRLLRRLRNHLGLKIQDHYILQARHKRFPKTNNEMHTAKEIKDQLTELQKRGILFYCNQHERGPSLVIPEELVPGVKWVLGIELNKSSFRLLLDRLTSAQLKRILDSNSLPVSGSKEDQIDRIVEVGMEPSQVLRYLQTDELYSLCKKLPGVKVSGSKYERIWSLIEYFDSLRTREKSDKKDERGLLYDYYVELASRDRANLLGNNVITKDKDIDLAFENATRYLFEQKCDLSSVHQSGSEHPDGLFEVEGREAVIMWDTKSKESAYSFPNDHFRQFKRYIRDSSRRVECFIVIVPEVTDSAIENAYRLKYESGQDTDVALIAADDLKWLAESWTKYSRNKERLNLDVLNATGKIDRQFLERQLKIVS